MKKLFVLCLIPVLFGCGKEENVKTLILGPNVSIAIDNGRVQLLFRESMFFHSFCFAEPVVIFDEMEIYIAEKTMSNFRKLTEFRIEELNNQENITYTVDNLQNSVPYFFHFVLKKEGFSHQKSDNIMVVPNKRNEFEVLPRHGSIAHNINKIAFTGSFEMRYSAIGHVTSGYVAISNVDGTEKKIIDIFAEHPRWSPNDNKLAFQTSNRNRGVVEWATPPEITPWSESSLMPSQIALYDYDTEVTTLLTDGEYENKAPMFSPNGALLIFESEKNAPKFDPENRPPRPANIWLINLNTSELHQVTDVLKASLRSAERPSWIDHDRFLFQGVKSGGRYQIYESSVSAKQINRVFESQWNDYTPSSSPDQRKIAFISDRTGENQVWIYHIDTNTFSQITGYSYGDHVTQYCNIDWLDDSTIVFTVINQLTWTTIKQRIP